MEGSWRTSPMTGRTTHLCTDTTRPSISTSTSIRKRRDRRLPRALRAVQGQQRQDALQRISGCGRVRQPLCAVDRAVLCRLLFHDARASGHADDAHLQRAQFHHDGLSGHHRLLRSGRRPVSAGRRLCAERARLSRECVQVSARCRRISRFRRDHDGGRRRFGRIFQGGHRQCERGAAAADGRFACQRGEREPVLAFLQ